MNIGERIKQKREELGMTQTELAEAVGYSSKTTINKIEKGVNDIRQNMIVKFANALKTTPADLMGWKDETEAVDQGTYYLNDDAKELAQFMYDNPEYKVLFDATRNVSKEDIEVVRQIIDKFRRYE